MIDFWVWINGELSKSSNTWLSKSIFNVKNHPNLSQFFFHWRTPIFEHIFFVIDIFWLNDFWSFYYILKWWPIFDSSPIIKNSKFNNFLWVCWFICKNLFNFVPPLENSTTRIVILASLVLVASCLAQNLAF